MNLFYRPTPSPDELDELTRLINQLADAQVAMGRALFPTLGKDETASFVRHLRRRAQDPKAYWAHAMRPPLFASTPLVMAAPQPGQAAGMYGPMITRALPAGASIACCEAARDANLASAQAR